MHAALCPIILPRYYNISLENPHVSCDDHTDVVGAVALPDTYNKKIPHLWGLRTQLAELSWWPPLRSPRHM